jgi:hypothetical protein
MWSRWTRLQEHICSWKSQWPRYTTDSQSEAKYEYIQDMHPVPYSVIELHGWQQLDSQWLQITITWIGAEDKITIQTYLLWVYADTWADRLIFNLKFVVKASKSTTDILPKPSSKLLGPEIRVHASSVIVSKKFIVVTADSHTHTRTSHHCESLLARTQSL